MAVVEELERARAALEAGEPERALAALLAAWRAGPTRRVAELVEALSAVLGAGRRRPGGHDRASRELAWQAMAAAGDPADVALLLATLAEGTSAQAVSRARALARRPDDPRISAAFLGWLCRPPFRTRAFRPFGSVAIEVLERCPDPRVVDVHLGRARGLGRWTESVQERVSTVWHQALERELTPDAVAVADAVAAGIEEVAAASGRASAAALLAQIRADPTDDAARAIYADLLQEAGDPHGELIALQLGEQTAASARRQRSLLRAHGRVWLGTIAGALRSDLVFARGFVSEVVLAHRRSTPLAELVDAPEWATVERLDTNGCRDPALARVAARMPALEALLAVSPRVFAAFGELGLTCQVRTLEYQLHYGAGPEAVASLLSSLGPFPRLERLVVRGCVRPDARLAGLLRGLEETLREFVVDTYLSHLGAWFACLESGEVGMPVTLEANHWRIALRRVDDGWRMRACPTTEGWLAWALPDLDGLAEELESLPRIDGLRMEVEAPKGSQVEDRRRIEVAASRVAVAFEWR